MSLASDLGRTKRSTFRWSREDCILYGLAVGAGATAQELKYVYESRLVPLPTFSSVIAREAGLKASDLSVDYSKVVHKSQTTRFHRPLTCCGVSDVSSRVLRIEDQGTAKGAEIRIETLLSNPSDGQLTATIETVLQARGDGSSPTQAPKPPRILMPDRDPDLTVHMQVARHSALLYRLCGDKNPIHVDPLTAALAGFSGPLLHGLCVYGMACLALVRACCTLDESRLASLHVNFTAPVFPGDELELHIWLAENNVAFQVSAPARQSLVAGGCSATLRAAQ